MGDTSASLDDLVANSAWLRRLARSLVKDDAEADDLVQDTWLVAAERAPADGRPLRPWLHVVLLNLVRMRFRGTRRRLARDEAVGRLANPPATPAELVGQVEMHRMLASLVLALDPPLRDVVLLRYFEHRTSVEIGKQLGVSDGTARWRLKHALEELRRHLDKREPNRAWVPALAGFARRAPGGLAPKVLLALLVALIAAVVLVIVHIAPEDAAAPASRARRDVAATSVSAPARPRLAPNLDLAEYAGVHDETTLAGIVVDDQDQPVGGANVELICQYIELAPLVAETTGDGRFSFQIDPDCHWSVIARRGTVVYATDGGSPLTLRPRPVSTVIVRVVDLATGRPVAGARVRMINERHRDSITRDAGLTDADGIATLNKLSTLLGFAVTADGYTEDHTRCDPAPPEGSFRCAIGLRPGIPIRGRLLGPDKAGVAGDVDVRTPDGVAPQLGAEGSSDATGAFELWVPRPGTYQICARADHLALDCDTVDPIEVPTSGRSGITLTLGHLAAIAGTVTDSAGHRVAGATVRLAYARPQRTNDRGEFAFPEVYGDAVISATMDRLASQEEILSTTTGTVKLALVLGAGGLAGRVVDREGAPVTAAHVRLHPHGIASGIQVGVDRHGRFTFDDDAVPRGTFTLSVRRDSEDEFDDDNDVQVQGGDHAIELVVP